MATEDGRGHWYQGKNPFPPAAVAHISDLRPELPTIKTGAIREIDGLIDTYLRATQVTEANGKDTSGERLANTGQVLVIEGDYGTGKTHLAIEILDRVEEGARLYGRGDTRVIYHVAPGGTFLVLYTDLMNRAISVYEVLARVREFYADIVADEVRDRPFTRELAVQLERDDVDPEVVIRQFGFREGALRQKLRDRLSSVTSDEAFSRALILLLQEDLRPMVWDWLTGRPPSQILVERGIAKPIQTDAQALEALGVLALLYGRKNRRFVLIIDEMEKLVLTWDRSPNANAQAFKKLLEVFHGAGALLVACGLSDIFAVLPRDPGRIDAVIRPSLLTEDEVRWYIEEAQARVNDERVLEPFNDESIKYIIYLTGGVAREVLRFCYYAYEYASETGREVTPSVVNAIVRTRSPGGGKEFVRSEIERLLFEQGWKANRHWFLGDPPDVTVDFWIPVSGQDAGCAILISDSVLEEAQASVLAARLTAIKSAGQRRAVVLVVSGYLPGNLRQSLMDALAEDMLIVYSPRSFDDDFYTTVSAAIDRVGPVQPGPAPAALADSEFQLLRTETQRVARQQANTLRLVQEFASHFEDRLGSIQRLIETASVPSSAQDSRPADLSSELEAMFDTAQSSLDAYGNVDVFLRETFTIVADEPGNRLSVTHRLREPDAFNSIGVAAFLDELLASFRESIQGWFGLLGFGRVDAGGPTESERERLRWICRTFDSLYNVVPLFKLDPLPDITSLSGGEKEAVARMGRSVRREALRNAFDGLGDRVYKASINRAGGADVPQSFSD
jgi:hypothetical protein